MTDKTETKTGIVNVIAHNIDLLKRARAYIKGVYANQTTPAGLHAGLRLAIDIIDSRLTEANRELAQHNNRAGGHRK